MTAAPHPQAPVAGLDPAGLGARIGANLLDGLISAWPLLLAVAGLLLSPDLGLVVLLYLLWLANSVVVGLVNWGMTARRGWTLGQRVLGLRVLDDTTGDPIGWGRAFVRQLVLGLLSVTGIGLLVNGVVIAGDPRGRGWHDGATGARVVTLRGAGSPRTAAPAPHDGWGHDGRGFPTPAPGPPAPGPATHPAAAGPPSLATPRPSTAADLPPATTPPSPVPGLVPGVLAPPPPVARGAAPPLITRAPGAPEPQVAPAAHPSPPVAVPVAVPDGDLTRGRPAPRAAVGSVAGAPAQGLVLRLGDGQVLPQATRVVVGRQPAEAAGATAVAVADPARSLSKTHAEFERRTGVGTVSGGLTVRDLGSTNGVAVVRGTQQLLVEPASPAELRAGDRVLLGDYEITVEEQP